MPRATPLRRDLGWIEIRLRTGESMRTIADDYGYTHVRIGQVRREHGLPGRPGRVGSHREGNNRWRGGIMMNNGYRMIYTGRVATCRGYEMEHRLVMEKKIGRRLRPEEEVHHEDGDKLNNEPSNLRLFATTAEHAAFHARGGDLP